MRSKPPSRWRHVRKSIGNVLKLASGRRFTAPYQTDFEVVHKNARFSLRHYAGGQVGGSLLLLVPPLMVTTEIYDMSPDLSVVLWLTARGHDVWAVDFGTPELSPMGREKTLADHVLAVDEAIEQVGRHAAAQHGPARLHLVGYSQGGMFVYQAAAYRQCRFVASIITLGSPVDLLRNVPLAVKRSVLSAMLHDVGRVIEPPLRQLPFLPGWLTSVGFKLASPRQELRHFLLMLRLLDDEEALKRLEPTRRFLGGEGFVGWPGPAFRTFVDDFVVHNRMLTGGFVIAGRTVSVSDLTVPVLHFRGLRDDFARPAAVSAIERVVPHDQVFGAAIDTGHLGLLIGTRAQNEVWPTIEEWLAFCDRGGPKPGRIGRHAKPSLHTTARLRLLSAAKRALWQKAGALAHDVTRSGGFVRFQLPRLLRLLRTTDGARVSMAALLKEQARVLSDHCFFLWEGRAFTYAEADRRVTHLAGALYGCGILPGQTVGLLFDNHPDCLTALLAAGRLGVTCAIFNPNLRGAALAHALDVTQVRDLISLRSVDELPGLPSTVRRLFLGKPEAAAASAQTPKTPAAHATAAVDLENAWAALPDTVPLDAGRAGDIACLLFTSGTTGKPKAVKISNRRVLLAATAAAAGCHLTPKDTVYCCLPLHHGTGLLLAAGGALLGGSRLAVAPRFSARKFWEDVRRTGATVVFYVGELVRYLVAAPASPLERGHAVRLFVGNGLRPEVWQALLTRFGPVSVLEFYAATEGNVVMTNLTGEKIGSVGRVPFGLVRTFIAQYDVQSATLLRGPDGLVLPCPTARPGMLLTEISPLNPLSRFDGYTDPDATQAKIVRDVLRPGDAWFCSGDLLRQDEDGDHFFVDRVGDTYRCKGENVSTEQVAGVIASLPFVEMCAVYGVRVEGREGRTGMAALKLRPGQPFGPTELYRIVTEQLIEPARPLFVRLMAELPTTETLKIDKQPLLADGFELTACKPLFVYDPAQNTYREVTETDPLPPL